MIARMAVGVVMAWMLALLVGQGDALVAQGATTSASAVIWDVQGRAVGKATFTSVAGGAVRVAVEVSGYNPIAGDHGLHIHEVGRCDLPDFTSAGDHFNPTGAQHGLENPAGPHAGDLPNMQFLPDGSGTYEATTNRITLEPGATSLFDADGSAIVIHASADDQRSDPSGKSEERIGCGVIVPDGAPAPDAEPDSDPPPAQPVPDAQSVTGHAVVPEQRPWSAARMRQLRLPAGFQISVFASGLGNARMMAFGPDGTLYVTRRTEGDVLALRDQNGDGRAEAPRTVAANLPLVHGITIHQRTLYLATDTQLLSATIRADGSLSARRTLVRDLPSGGQHPNRTLAVGPDGNLYITVGSTCNACKESDEESATILRANLDGSGRTVYASGLRNTIGFGWHPTTGQLWGMDHGSDWRGDDQPPEELNRLQAGGNYGWPFCFGNRQVDAYLPAEPEGTTRAAYCAGTVPPVLTYQAHSAPIGMVFYTGEQFPAAYRGDAFVAMRGSWNRNPPTGYKVVRIRFQNGQPVAFEDFLTGFLIEGGAAHFGRLAGLVVAPDGSLLVSDDTNGVIYRVRYVGS